MSYGERRHTIGAGAVQRLEMPGNILDEERRIENRGLRRNTPYQKRYCETCNSHKPKGTRKAVKGWKCDDCRDKIINGMAECVK